MHDTIKRLLLGGENMEGLTGVGIFFAGFFGGLGFFFIGCALFWWVSVYKKLNEPKQK